MIFSEELRRRRQALGLGQVAFAMKIRRAAAQHGWSEPALDGNTVSRWEAGRQMPDAFHQLLIGDVLGLTAAEIATWQRPVRTTDRMTPVRRREFLRLGTGVAGGALLDGWRLASQVERLVAPGPLSPEERSVLTNMIGKNIAAGLQLFHVADTEHMLSVGRAQLLTLRRHRTDVDADALPALYSASSRLLGATYHRRGRYADALDAHGKAYLAASEAGDVWSMAQCRAWQAYGRQALGDHAASLQIARTALRLISDRSDIDSVRLRGRLLTSAAMNAATLKDTYQVGAMLEASEALLDHLDAPSEEFDRAVWLDSRGVCALRLGQAQQAAGEFQDALRQTPDQWTSRRMFTSIGLASALTEGGDVDAALAVSDGLVPHLRAMQSRELTDHFTGFLRTGILAKYPGLPHGQTLLANAAHSLQQQ